MQEGLGIRYDSTPGQLVIVLLLALKTLNKPASKQEVLEYIQEQGWLDLKPEDRVPYPTVTNREPRWQTLIAWARERCAEAEWIPRKPRDCWQANKDGLNQAVILKKRFSTQELSVKRCYMWSRSFKILMDPTYIADDVDDPRPKYVYEENLPAYQKSVRGSEDSRLIDRAKEILDWL